MLQTTLAKSIECSGIGLHSGRKVLLSLHPAPENTGILFCLRSENGTKFLSPTPHTAVSTELATTLGNGSDSVATVEHLLAAIRGLEIDNVRVEVEGGEAPILDGSAASFVFLLRNAGIRRQAKPRRVLYAVKTMVMQEDGKYVRLSPANNLSVHYTIDFKHPLIGVQSLRLDLSPDTFVKEIAKARTFGFLKDVELMQRNGLALGGSLDNAVVLDEFNAVNPEGLRFPDEFVRHKILDFIGDMALMELPIIGHFEVRCSGHAFNNKFLRHLDKNRSTYLQEAKLQAPKDTRAKAPITTPQPDGLPATA